MRSPVKSPQHQQAHGQQGSYLKPSNKLDVASFVEGVASNTPLNESYYHCHFLSSEHSVFYYILEATRRVNNATLTYQGRTADIKKAIFSSRDIQDIYRAGVMSGGGFNEDLRQAIFNACSPPTHR